MAEIGAKLQRTAEVGTGIALFAGFAAFMGFVTVVVMPFALYEILAAEVREKLG